MFGGFPTWPSRTGEVWLFSSFRLRRGRALEGWGNASEDLRQRLGGKLGTAWSSAGRGLQERMEPAGFQSGHGLS